MYTETLEAELANNGELQENKPETCGRRQASTDRRKTPQPPSPCGILVGRQEDSEDGEHGHVDPARW